MQTSDKKILGNILMMFIKQIHLQRERESEKEVRESEGDRFYLRVGND